MKRCLLFLFILSSAVHAQSPLTLDDAIGTALKNNFDIRVSKSSAEIAEANNTAGNAGMLPTLSLDGSIGTVQKNGTGVSAGVTTTSETSTVSGATAVQLNWTLFDGGKMFVTRQKLRETAQLGELRFQETVQATLYEVVASYYNLVRLQQQLRSIKQTIRYNQERVTIAQTGFNAGSLSKPDLLQAKTDLNEVLESSINQEFAIREAKRNLNSLLARDTEADLSIVDSIPNQYQPDRTALIQKLNTSNASLLAFQKNLEISRLALKETRSNFLPRLDLSASYGWNGVNDFVAPGYNNSLGLNVGGYFSIPLYQAGESNRKKKVAERTVEASQAELESIKLQLNLALQNALNDFDNHQALLNIEEENNVMTKEYLEISIQRLRLGQTNSLEVHLAQEKFMNSNTRLINYRFNLKLAETKLRQLIAAL